MRLEYSFIASGTEDVASSRIRAFGLGAALARQGHGVTFSDGLSGDILYIQKNWSCDTLRRARAAKDKGTLIIFDLDDVQFPELTGPLFLDVLRIADVITTDTEGKKAWIEKVFECKNVRIVPDAIDYAPTQPEAPMLRDTQRLRVLWFGSHSNIRLFEQNMEVLSGNEHIEIVVIAQARDVEEYRVKYPRVTFIPWSKDLFLRDLQSCDVTCLTHSGTELDLLRSNNKMIVSINWGVPALVSNTPEYLRTARDLGVEWTVFGSNAELLQGIEAMRSRTTREKYLVQTQPAVWSSYSPDAVARLFSQLVAEFAAGLPTNRTPRQTIGGLARRALFSVTDLARFGVWRLKRMTLAARREGFGGIVRRTRILLPVSTKTNKSQ